MFDSIKEWIEGLFQPVIRTTENQTYIARTPTIFDYTQWTGPQYVKGSITMLAANGIYTGQWHSFNSDALLLGGTVAGLTSTRSATYDIGTQNDFVRGVFSTVAGAASDTTPFLPQIETLSRVIKRGESIRVVVQNNSGIAATPTYTIRTTELRQ